MDRRSFLAGAAGAALQSDEVRLPKKIRLAMIGLLGHASEMTSQLKRLPDVELVAVAERARREPRPGAKYKVYDDYRRMLDAEKPDVVGVCNAGDERAGAILECIGRGLHWVAEKPLANEVADLEKIRKALAAAPRVRFSMLLGMRFSPPYVAMKTVVDSGEAGEVAQISAQKSYKAGNRDEWMRNRKSYGGTIPWIGIHMVDLMRFTSGRDFTEAMSYQAQIGSFPGIGQMENTTGTVFRLDNRGVATLHMDYYRPEMAPTHGDDRLRLAGTKGVVEYMAATGVTVVSGGRKPEVIRDLPPARSLFVDFLESVYNGKTHGLSPADILRNCEIVLKTRDGAEQGRIVKL